MLLLTLVFSSLLLQFSRNDALEVDDALLETMNFRAKAHQVLVNLQGLPVLLLALKSVAQGQECIDIIFAVLNTLFEVIDRLRVFTTNIVQNARVVEHNRVGRV